MASSPRMRYKSRRLPVRALGPGGKILDRDGFAMPVQIARSLVGSLLLLMLAAWSVGPAAAAPYVVTGVPVDVTAADAVTARDQAILEGQRKAFAMLMEQQLGPEQAATIKTPSDDHLSAMIENFEVESERISGVRYVGVLTFRFDQASVDAATGKAPDPTAEVVTDAMPSGPVRTITVDVPIGSLRDWLEVQRRLSVIRTVQRTDVRGIARTEGELNLVFFGDEAALQQALAQQQLTLSKDDQRWVLQLGSDGGAATSTP